MSDKINCNIVRDLIPSYVDDICSDESRELVEKHIKECEECRKMVASMKEDLEPAAVKKNSVSANTSIDEQKVMQAVNKKLNNDIKKKTLVYKVICLLIVVIIIILMLPLKTIPANAIELDYKTYKTSDFFEMEDDEEKSYNKISNAVLLYSDGVDTENISMYKFTASEEMDFYPLYADAKWVSEHEYITITRIKSKYPVEKYNYTITQDNDKNIINLNKVTTKIITGESAGDNVVCFIVPASVDGSRISY